MKSVKLDRATCGATIATVALLVSVGCGTGASGAVQESAADDPTVNEADIGRMPLGDFLSRRESALRTVDLAVQESIAECMRAAGFSYVPAQIGTSFTNPLNRYGWVNLEHAKEWGYHGPEALDGGVNALTPRYSGDELVRYHAALEGPGTAPTIIELQREDGSAIGSLGIAGGCIGAATADVLGGTDEMIRFFTDLGIVEDFSEQSYLYWTANIRPDLDAEWADCMSKKGFDEYESPDEPLGRLWAPAEADVEVATATADVECKDDVHYVARSIAAESDWLEPRVPLFQESLLEFWQTVGGVAAGS